MTDKKPRVLIVDDEEMVGRAMTRLMRRAGYEVINVTNVDDGVKAFSEDTEIRVVISDIEMKIKTGYALFEEINEELVRREGAFIAMTGNDDAGKHFQSIGIPVVPKPLPRGVEDFLELIRQK